MLVKGNPVEEEKMISELVESDEALKQQHQFFLAEMKFKQELIEMRKGQCSHSSGFSGM